jgi:hypothetical protein
LVVLAVVDGAGVEEVVEVEEDEVEDESSTFFPELGGVKREGPLAAGVDVFFPSSIAIEGDAAFFTADAAGLGLEGAGVAAAFGFEAALEAGLEKKEKSEPCFLVDMMR